MFVNLAPDIVQMKVDLVGFDTFAFSMTSFDFSDGTWGGNLRTELGNAPLMVIRCISLAFDGCKIKFGEAVC